MALFSDRLELAHASIIVDDAPSWFRSVFYEQVMAPHIAPDKYRDEGITFNRPISPHWFLERLSQLTRTDIGIAYHGPYKAKALLRQFLLKCEWFYFFDSIEIAAEVIRDRDKEASKYKGYENFTDFRSRCDDVCRMSGVGWTLEAKGKLVRSANEERVFAEAQLSTLELHSPAKVHLAKAKLMLNQRPCDAANVIKESVSAIESAGRKAYPKTTTLGDVLKAMKGDAVAPPLFIAFLEKLYGFACSEPGVRHGNSTDERVTRAEAEFIYTTALSTLTYLEALGLL